MEILKTERNEDFEEVSFFPSIVDHCEQKNEEEEEEWNRNKMSDQLIFKHPYFPYSSHIFIIIRTLSFVFSIYKCPPIHFLPTDFRCNLSLV